MVVRTRLQEVRPVVPQGICVAKCQLISVTAYKDSHPQNTSQKPEKRCKLQENSV